MVVPYDEVLGIQPQDDKSDTHAEWDFQGTPAADYLLLLRHHYVQLYRHQVVKQADVVLAMALCGRAFTPEQKRRNVGYYQARTVRD